MGEIMEDFEPTIIAFVCNWCAYAGADLAGVSRMQYPTHVRLIRLMCSGRVNHGFLLKAFLRCIMRLGKNQVAEKTILVKFLVGPMQNLHGLGESANQIATHIQILASLTWENKGQFTGRFRTTEEDIV